MFRNRTVFVIGAGAGQEIDMPVGSTLRKIITEKLSFRSDDFGGGFNISSGDRTLYSIIKDNNDYFRASRQISNSLPLVDSIDDFVDSHAGDKAIEFCAKISIVKSILESEKQSKLYLDERASPANINWDNINCVWLMRLFRNLRVGLNKNNIADISKNIAFINFNYDRSLEHFLFHAIRDLFSKSAPEAAEVVSAIPIYHPYGTVGRLPWQSGDQIECEYGGTAMHQHLITLSGGIKTYTEQVGSRFLEEMHQVFDDIDVLIFLGFAFHVQNMNLLRPAQGLRLSKIMGTAFERSKADTEIIEGVRLQGLLDPQAGSPTIDLVDLTCGNFLRDYGIAMRGA